jgi:hypothetical protein
MRSSAAAPSSGTANDSLVERSGLPPLSRGGHSAWQNEHRPHLPEILIFLYFKPAKLCRDSDEVGERIGLHFLHDLSTVCLHSAFADPKFTADLFVQ